MPEEQRPISLNSVAILIALAIQIGGFVWAMATMHSTISYNKETLKEISSKLSNELDQAELRLRAAEQELFILKTLVDIELKANERD